MADDCCLRDSRWEGTPKGYETNIGENKAYVTGNNPDACIMVVHDLFGWTLKNIRLLADFYAEEADATVYVPDFYGGEALPPKPLLDLSRWKELGVPAFIERNTKAIREPEIFACARALRSKYKRLGTIGFCWGGWAVFRLGAKEYNPHVYDSDEGFSGKNLVDCISTGHPSWLTKEEIQEVNVPVQLIAPEFDKQFSPELKEFSQKTIPALGLPLDYQYFPGVEHAFSTKGYWGDIKERRAMERSKNVAAAWFKEWLHCE